MKKHILITVAEGLCLCYFLQAGPPNDNFVDREQLTGASGYVYGNNIGATIESGEPWHNGRYPEYRSVWYTWTAPASGEYAFDTRNVATKFGIKVYTGNSIIHLSSASILGEKYIHFMATAGTEYQVAVFSYEDKNVSFKLNFYPDTLHWYVQQASTNDFISVYATRKGVLAYVTGLREYYARWQTNAYGLRASGESKYTYAIDGLTILDKDSNPIVSNITPEDAGTHYQVQYFDGKYLYLYNQNSKAIILYRLKKNSLVKMGLQTLDGMNGFGILGKYALASHTQKDFQTQFYRQGMKVFDRNLKKLLWEEPLSKASVWRLNQKGYYQHAVFGEYDMTWSICKKGTKLCTVTIPYIGKFMFSYLDEKGNLLYWYYIPGYYANTNDPVSTINKKGDTILDNESLPGIGNAWMHGNFNKGIFYVMTVEGTDKRGIHGFKMGKTIKQLGSGSVDFARYVAIHDSRVTILQEQQSTPYYYGFTQYDKKLKKILWTEPLLEGYVRYVDKGVFLREWKAVSGSQTNYHAKIFNQKGTIVEHVIPLY